MATTLYMRRKFGSLIPLDAESEAALSRIGSNARLKCVVTQPRNTKRLAYYWVIVNEIFNNQEFYKTPEQLHEAIKYHLGYVKTFFLKNGTEITKTKSIAIDKMDEIEFARFLDRFIEMVCQEIIPALSEGALRNRLSELTTEAA